MAQGESDSPMVVLISGILLLGAIAAFIKLGQLLSARPDVLPASWVAELSSLQDSVPAFSFDTAQSLLEQELGERCAEIIDIEEQPLGAASLAQVHRASLRSGRQVVFKIQRPGLERLFRLDLEVMQQVAAVLQRHPQWGVGRDWVSIAQECRRVLLRELDFRLEAEHAARFRQQFLDDPGIRIPAVVWELTTRRVLCLDYVPGIKINDRQALIEAGIDPSAVAEKGAASYLQQLVRFGFFHADPHPGNLAVAGIGLPAAAQSQPESATHPAVDLRPKRARATHPRDPDHQRPDQSELVSRPEAIACSRARWSSST